MLFGFLAQKCQNECKSGAQTTRTCFIYQKAVFDSPARLDRHPAALSNYELAGPAVEGNGISKWGEHARKPPSPKKTGAYTYKNVPFR